MTYYSAVTALSPIRYWRMAENNTITSPHTYDFTGTNGTNLLSSSYSRDFETANSARTLTINNNKMLVDVPDDSVTSFVICNNLFRGNVDVTVDLDVLEQDGSGNEQLATLNLRDEVTQNRIKVNYRDDTGNWDIVIYNAGVAVGGTTSVSSGTDAKVRAVLTGTTAQVYIDDVLRRTESITSMTSSSASVLFFSNNTTNHHQFTIDNLQITASAGVSGVWSILDEIGGRDAILIERNTASSPYQTSLVTTDPINRSMLFDEDGYFNIADDDAYSVNTTGKLAVSFLFNTPDTTAAQGLVSKNNGTVFEWDIHVFSDEIVARLTDNLGNTIRSETASVADGITYHVVVNFTGSTSSDEIEIYLDGVKSNTLESSDGTKTYSNTTAPVNVGMFWSNVADFFLTNGHLDEVILFSDNLSQAEVTALYEAASGDISLPQVGGFLSIGTTTYKFWENYETLSSNIPVATAWLDFETDLTTALVGPNWIKKGIDNIARNNVSGVDGYYATLEGDLSQASCLALDTTTANIPANASVSLWFYVPSGYSTDENNLTAALFANKLDTESSFRRIDYLPDNTLRMVTQDSVEGQISHVFPTTVTEGEWHHVAYVSDGVRQKIFLDGVKSEITLPNGIPSFDVYVSIFGSYNGDADTTAGAFHGRIDNFKIFDRILTDNEVLALSNEFTP